MPNAAITLIAYRGGAAEGPENTCEAALATAALRPPDGVSLAIEVDVRFSSDGVPVLLHDAALERVTNGRGQVSETSLAGLRRLQVSAPNGGAPGRVPTLHELLDAVPDLPLILDLHDPRADLPGRVVSLLRDRSQNWSERIVIASENARHIAAVRSLAPEVSTSASSWEVLKRIGSGLLGLSAPRCPQLVWMVPERHHAVPILTPRFASAAAERGEAVWAWVAEDAPALRRFLRLGATGVFTPCPAAMLRAL